MILTPPRYDAQAKGEGIRNDCESCHLKETRSYRIGSRAMDSAGVACIDCHMPRISGSGRTHLFAVTTDAADNQFKDDKTSNPFISLEFACLTCHGSDTGKAVITGKDKVWAAAYARGVHGEASDTSMIYSPITDFDLKYLSGEFSEFRDLAGRKLFIFYASSTCPHCKSAYPPVAELSDTLDAMDVHTILIFSRFSTQETIETFTTGPITIPVFHDTEGAFFSQYGQTFVPMFMAVNEKRQWLRRTGYSDSLFLDMKEEYLEFLN